MFSAFDLNVISMQCSRLLKKSQKRLYWNFACSLKIKKKTKNCKRFKYNENNNQYMSD